MARTKITVSGKGYDNGWTVTNSDGIANKPGVSKFSRTTKALAVTLARSLAKKIERRGELAQVVVKNRKGRIQFEWTYPRFSDPRPKPRQKRNRG